MSYICPYCQTSLPPGGGRCPSCRQEIVIADWPEEAISSAGMNAVLTLKCNSISQRAISDNFIIGRDPGLDGFEVQNVTVSRQHVSIVRQNGEWKAIKLKSFTCNGQAVEDETVLSSGCVLGIGAAVVEAVVQYELPLPELQPVGRLESDLSTPLNSPRLYIGSNRLRCNIIIEKAAGVHALIYVHSKTGERWIADCDSPTGVRVNGEGVKNKKLMTGDEITIASVSLRVTSAGIVSGISPDSGISLEVKSLSASDGSFQILDDVSFRIAPGEFIGVIGPSGCGKSSLIQRLIGLASCSGEILVNGVSMGDIRPDFLNQTSYLPQQPALHESLTLRQECVCFCTMRKTAQYNPEEEIPAALKLVGLENEQGKRVGDLSGGQRRRAAIALELLRQPQLLLLDEPTSGLDPASETEVMEYLRRIADQKKTVVCSTHLIDNWNLFDKVLFLSRGRLIFFGSASKLMGHFETGKPLDIYQNLSRGTIAEQIETAKELANQYKNSYAWTNKNAPGAAKPLEHKIAPMFFNALTGYLRRYYHELFSFCNSSAPWKEFFFSPLFILLIFQPLLIAMAIKLSCAYKLYDSEGVSDVFFFCAISLFWLGLNNSVRELVSERAPGRCLERLEQLGSASYLSSKLIWGMGLCLFQTALFCAVFWGFPHFTCTGVTRENHLCWTIFLPLILYSVCLLGACCALAISAFFKNENAAVGMLPIILIPILLFSYPVIKERSNEFIDKAEPQRNYNDMAVYLEWGMPCFQPMVLMKQTNEYYFQRYLEGKKKPSERNNVLIQEAEKSMTKKLLYFSLTVIPYFVVSLTGMVLFQRHNETSWKGR